MATTALQIMSHIHITPLLTIHHPPFAKLYRDGVFWSLYKERCTSPLSDHYMLENVRANLKETDVDNQHAYCLPPLGFHFGCLHGAILSPRTGRPRRDVTELARFEHEDARCKFWKFVGANVIITWAIRPL